MSSDAPTTVKLEQPIHPGASNQGRNELCACGSGKKWKKCCGKKPALKPGDMRSLVFMLLTSCGGGITVPNSTFDEFRDQDGGPPGFNAAYDPETKTWKFWVDKPKQPGILVPTRQLKRPTPNPTKGPKLIIN